MINSSEGRESSVNQIIGEIDNGRESAQGNLMLRLERQSKKLKAATVMIRTARILPRVTQFARIAHLAGIKVPRTLAGHAV
jgi:hypothetical protein